MSDDSGASFRVNAYYGPGLTVTNIDVEMGPSPRVADLAHACHLIGHLAHLGEDGVSDDYYGDGELSG